MSLRCEVERRAPIDRRFRPDPPAVTLNDALDDRQADAGALEILRAMQPLEHAEQLVGVAHVETGAIVANKEHAFAAAVA